MSSSNVNTLQPFDVDLGLYKDFEFTRSTESINNTNSSQNKILKQKSIPSHYLHPEERAILHTLSKDSKVARLVQYKNNFLKLSLQDILVTWKNVCVEVLRESLVLIDNDEMSITNLFNVLKKNDRLMYVGFTIVFLSIIIYVFQIVV